MELHGPIPPKALFILKKIKDIFGSPKNVTEHWRELRLYLVPIKFEEKYKKENRKEK